MCLCIKPRCSLSHIHTDFQSEVVYKALQAPKALLIQKLNLGCRSPFRYDSISVLTLSLVLVSCLVCSLLCFFLSQDSLVCSTLTHPSRLRNEAYGLVRYSIRKSMSQINTLLFYVGILFHSPSMHPWSRNDA